MKKLLYALILFVVVFVIGILSFWVYVKQLSIEDRWLLFTKKVASQYAKELLAAQPFPKIPSTTQPFQLCINNQVIINKNYFLTKNITHPPF